MPKSGSQVAICDMPVRFDTYKGCSHLCSYCFVQMKYDISKIDKGEGPEALKNFIKGKRDQTTNWCDWNIPIHWGGVSDPFQPVEKAHRLSLEALRVFAETKYPVVVSTKGALIAEEPYLSLLEKCNMVVQISLVSPKYDEIEKGAPTYEERIEIIKKVAPKVKRLIIRVQPFILEAKEDLIKAIPRYKAIGVHGITIEGIKHKRKKKGLVKIGGDFVYPVNILKRTFSEIKQVCKDNDLAFYSAENRLRKMGDSLNCCGIEGVKGFKGNTYNLNHFLYDKKHFVPTASMKTKGSAMCMKAISQKSSSIGFFKMKSFQDVMEMSIKDKGMVSQLIEK